MPILGVESRIVTYDGNRRFAGQKLGKVVKPLTQSASNEPLSSLLGIEISVNESHLEVLLKKCVVVRRATLKQILRTKVRFVT
jgi:hypothetical protein